MTAAKTYWKTLYSHARKDISKGKSDTHHIYCNKQLVTVQKCGKEILITRRANDATRASVARDHFHHVLNTLWAKRAPRDKWDKEILREDRKHSEHWGFKLP